MNKAQDPTPPQSWTGIRDALQYGPSCAQIDMLKHQLVGSEDCLYLNIATTSLSGSRPVMIFFHGGAFTYGNAKDDLYGEDYLVTAGIVYVAMNWRLAVLGFLHLDDPVVPGNMGLKDQTAALKWVKENISQFGGDPNNVTIFGVSSGGASVHYQILSPLSKGLFHKAIMQSGNALDHWATATKPADTLRRYIAALGKETSDPQEIVEFLRGLSIEELMKAQQDLIVPEDMRWLQFPFRPSVDDKSENPFMPRCPKELALKGSEVPLIIGYNSYEGNLLTRGMQNKVSTILDENSKLGLPDGLVTHDHPKRDAVSDEIRKFYFGDEPISEESAYDWIRACGDISYVFGAHKVVESQQKRIAPCYFYKFTFDVSRTFSKFYFNLSLESTIEGPGHADELPYIFNVKMAGDYLRFNPGTQERITSDRMIRMWTDFAKTGIPTSKIDDVINVEWLPVSQTTKHYLNIGAELSADTNPDEEVIHLRDNISEILNSN
ncbi:esterase E4-like isoform X2 [Athalia rosae]|uniref:esterase E4-like isoform X2 n=1 Tax=Athalia rosae TaxID=37344 RepID=UPI002034504C|nr:esterase E4-like isoform X2 [Athalia rosae]